MRLLQRKEDGSFCLTDYLLDTAPKYAILSHTWLVDDDEITFDELIEAIAQHEADGITVEALIKGHAKHKAADYKKIQFCLEQAAKDGLEYSWIYTCCINRSSSAELQEAIMSMFSWYRNAAKCYVYLPDLSVTEDEVERRAPPYSWESAFRNARWFTRGWTLQELLAPASVEFFSVQGTRLGDKSR
jgi:hypothetical protein